MSYKCKNEFMIRTPELSYEHLKDFREQPDEVFDYIKNNNYLDEFFKSALLVSSRPLYQAYTKTKIGQSEQKFEQSLLKFFIRSTTRPTPYGLFSSVCLGSFDHDAALIKGQSFYDIDIDSEWTCKLISSLEKNDSLVPKMILIRNNLLYKSGERIKNPCITSDVSVAETMINNTPLFTFIYNELDGGIRYGTLVDRIMNRYENVSREVVVSTIGVLISNDFIYTNFRLPPFCENRLEFITNQLQRVGYEGILVEQLKTIQSEISLFQRNKNLSTLESIYQTMKSIISNKNYLAVNTGNQFKESTLDEKLKQSLEKFVNFLTYLPSSPIENNVFKKDFIEAYGNDVEVPLTEIIDKNRFDYLKSLNEGKNASNNSRIESYMNSKISQAIINQEDEVSFKYSQLRGFQTENEQNLNKSFDLNVFITKSNEDYRLSLSPSFGASNNEAGSMFQRFSQCIDSEQFKKYESIYGITKKLTRNDYTVVEAREKVKFTRANNVTNNTQNYEYYMCFGTSDSNDEKQVYLEDIVVGLSDTDQFYLKSKKLNSKIKIVQDNMLNTQNSNPILQLLLNISDSYESNPIINFSQIFYGKSSSYTPRVCIEDIIISPKKWNLSNIDFFDDTNEGGKNINSISFKKIKKRYGIPDDVYLSFGDNRLLLNLRDDKNLEILFKELDQKNNVELQEVEPNFFENELVLDEKGKRYFPEFSFSFYSECKKESESYTTVDYPKTLVFSNKYISLCEDGWIYTKIYGLADRLEEFLTKLLPDFLSYLNNPDYFFIRYNDSEGKHIRLRFKFKSEEIAIKNLPTITSWLKELFSKKIINNYSFSIYNREINRYGGEKTINSCEMLFCRDSRLIVKDLKEIQKSEETDKALEKKYIKGISLMVFGFTNNIEDALEILDKRFYVNKYRKIYKKNSKTYQKIITSIFDYENDLSADEMQLVCILKDLRNKVEKLETEKKLTCTKADLLFSLIHMHCNRLNGDLELEAKYNEIVRNSVFQIVQMRRHNIVKV